MDPVDARALAEVKKLLDRTPFHACHIHHKIEVVDGVAYFLHPEGYACMWMPEEDLKAIANIAVKETT